MSTTAAPRAAGQSPAAPSTSLPPGPSGFRPLLVAQFLLRPTDLLERSRARFGDHFTVTLSPGRTVVITSDPQTVKQVFTGDPDLLHAGEGNVILQPLLGPRSVLLLDGPEHLRQRKLMLPPFHGERMKRYGEVMTEVAERHVARWPVGRPFATAPTLQAITLEVILRAVFGISEPQRLQQLGDALRHLLDSISGPVKVMGLQFASSQNPRPRTPWGRVRTLLRPADALLLDEIRTRRAARDSERDDILSLLLAARDEHGEALSDAELRDELMTLLVAGHETTATALAWTLERLVRHPEVLERLQAEQRDGGSDYLDATIKETLRLRPVVPAVVRKLTAPGEFGGYRLPAGVHIAPSIYLLHRRADLYPDPTAFRPERFLDRKPGTYEWIPFGGGIRRCLGASFALFEMRAVLQTVLRRAELATGSSTEERITRRTITFAPARGGRVVVRSLRAG